nr:AEL_HP1_G0019620.mRNA.1.CDS.1 [Saccharomyces cerevisiae]
MTTNQQHLPKNPHLHHQVLHPYDIAIACVVIPFEHAIFQDGQLSVLKSSDTSNNKINVKKNLSGPSPSQPQSPSATMPPPQSPSELSRISNSSTFRKGVRTGKLIGVVSLTDILSVLARKQTHHKIDPQMARKQKRAYRLKENQTKETGFLLYIYIYKEPSESGPMIKAVAEIFLVKRFYQQKLEKNFTGFTALKQKIRLAQNGSTTSTENPISFSQTMSEIFSVLQPSAPDLDEDETSGLKRDHLLTERLNNDELGVIMNKFFNPSSTHNNQLIDTNILLQNFPKLSGNDLDLLDFAINEKMRGNWNDLKQDFIQLWYYKSFGFLGPRTQFVLTNSSPSLRSQFLKLPFIEYNWFLLQNNKKENILPA